MATVLKLLRHRVTWRFLFMAAGALGAVRYADELSGLETIVCTVLTCSD